MESNIPGPSFLRVTVFAVLVSFFPIPKILANIFHIAIYTCPSASSSLTSVILISLS